jgi:hypothetical protein
MFRIIGRSITLAGFAKCMAIGAFFLFLSAYPINQRFSLFEKNEFIGLPSTRLDPSIVHWANFDGYYYLYIAKWGYGSDRVAFFPLYPLVIRSVIYLSDNIFPSVIAGQLVSFLSFVGAITMLFLLFRTDRLTKKTMLLFLLALLLFPTSYSYTAVYNDSLFFFLATLAIYLSRKKIWIWASVAAACATLTRLNGLALFPFLITEFISPASDNTSWQLPRYMSYLSKMKHNARALLPMVYALVIPAVFIAYLCYVQYAYGDWHILFTSMKQWGQDRMIFPLQTIFRYTKILTTVNPLLPVYQVAVLELGFYLWYIILLIWSWGKIRSSYWIFFFCSVLIPSLTGTFQGMPRYGLHLYPLFLATAHWLETKPRWLQTAYFALSICLYVICVTMFTHGIFIA